MRDYLINILRKIKNVKKQFIRVILLNMVVNKILSHRFRRFCYRRFGMKIGNGSTLFRKVDLSAPHNIEIGNNSIIGWYCWLDGRGGIKIGNNVGISSWSKLITGSHNINDPDFKGVFRPIIVEDYAYIFTGAMILPGVTIGEGAIVMAGSVVHKDVKPWTIVGGVPASVLGERLRNARYTLHYEPLFY